MAKQEAIQAIVTGNEGTKRSSNLKVTTTSTPVDSALNSFTIIGWTSTSRQITNKYNLVFHLRDADKEISPENTKAEWHTILKNTLNADDLKKLNPDD